MDGTSQQRSLWRGDLQLVLPTLRMACQQRHLALLMGSEKPRYHMAQIATTTDTDFFHFELYDYFENSFKASTKRVLSSWLRTAIRIYCLLGLRPGFRLQSRVRML